MIRRLLPLVFILAVVVDGVRGGRRPGARVRVRPSVRAARRRPAERRRASIPSVAVDRGRTRRSSRTSAFEEETEEGELPATRPVGAPTLPGVLLTTVGRGRHLDPRRDRDRGAGPQRHDAVLAGAEESVGKPVAANAQRPRHRRRRRDVPRRLGIGRGRVLRDGFARPGRRRNRSRPQLVTSTPRAGLSIAVDGQGRRGSPSTRPRRRRRRSTSPRPTARTGPSRAIADGRRVRRVRDRGPRHRRRGAAVAYSNGGDGVASRPTTARTAGRALDVANSGGAGLSATRRRRRRVSCTTTARRWWRRRGPATGPFRTTAVADVAEGAADAEGARTSIAATEDGATYAAWQDTEGIRFARGGGGGVQRRSRRRPDTDGGQMPSVAVAPDGSRAYLAWYDADEQDLLVGDVRRDRAGSPSRTRSPEPSGAPEAPAPPPDARAARTRWTAPSSIQAAAIAFDTLVHRRAGRASPSRSSSTTRTRASSTTSRSSRARTTSRTRSSRARSSRGRTRPRTTVEPLDAGEYYFHCDIHPNMNGTVNAGDGGGGGGGDGATGATGGATGTTGTTGTDRRTTGSTGGGGGRRAPSWRVNIAFDVARDRPAGRRGDDADLRQPGRGRAAQHRDLPDGGGPHRAAVPWRDDHRARAGRVHGSRRSKPASTTSTATCTRT